MGYRKIPNLYKEQLILMLKRLFALEKIHGTSANVKQKSLGGPLTFSSGGASHDLFVSVFDEDLKAKFDALGYDDVEVYGEAYGGSMQKMSHIYGPNLKFAVFEVRIHGTILDVPDAHDVADKLGLEFVDYVEIEATLEAIDEQRDRESVQAIRNGMGTGHPREGVVLRPLKELQTKLGEPIIVKHKGDAFKETATPRKVADPAELKVLEEAEAIALEWITDMRLDHVLDKIPGADITKTGQVIKAMVYDVLVEAEGEIVDSKEARKAIGNRARILFHRRVKKIKE